MGRPHPVRRSKAKRVALPGNGHPATMRQTMHRKADRTLDERVLLLYDPRCGVASVVEEVFRALGCRVQLLTNPQFPLHHLRRDQILGAVVRVDEPIALAERTFIHELRQAGLDAPVVVVVEEEVVSGVLIDALLRSGASAYVSWNPHRPADRFLELLVDVLLSPPSGP